MYILMTITLIRKFSKWQKLHRFLISASLASVETTSFPVLFYLRLILRRREISGYGRAVRRSYIRIFNTKLSITKPYKQYKILFNNEHSLVLGR